MFEKLSFKDLSRPEVAEVAAALIEEIIASPMLACVGIRCPE